MPDPTAMPSTETGLPREPAILVSEKSNKPSGENAALFAEDLEVGQEWASPLREISQADVEAFAQLTGDFDPLHALNSDGSPDESTSWRSPFGKPVAHGLLGMSVLAGLGTEYPRAATLALVGITDWTFENPIFFGAYVRVTTRILEVEKHGRRAVKVTWLRQLLSDSGQTLQQGKFVTLVASRVRIRPNARPRQPR